MASVGDLTLKQFVATYKLPQVAKVTQGHCADNDNDEHDLSTNDVLKVSVTYMYMYICCGRVEQSVGCLCVRKITFDLNDQFWRFILVKFASRFTPNLSHGRKMFLFG